MIGWCVCVWDVHNAACKIKSLNDRNGVGERESERAEVCIYAYPQYCIPCSY